MFRSIVSNLSYNPGMLQTLSFYSDRLKKERSIRRLSFVFIAITMVLQIVVVASPPERSLASSSNHIIDGIRTRDDILRAWDAPGSDVPAIYGTFGLTRNDIEGLTYNPNDTIVSRNGAGQDIWTIGRNSIQGRTDILRVHRNSQLSVQYAGDNTTTTADDRFVYMRNLESWNIKNSSNSYAAFKGKTASGKTFWILVDCGNFTQTGRWTPPPTPPPEPKPVISAACGFLSSSIVIKPEDTEVTVPVRISLPSGSSIKKGSTSKDGNSGSGLHLGVTSVGANKNWDVDNITTLSKPPLIPPDKQTNYVPTNNNLDGVTYYSYMWDIDSQTYRRYYVTSAHSSDFTVKINVKINNNDKKLVVRLLDRDAGEWLAHDSACEVPIKTQKAPEPEPPTPKVVIKKSIIDNPTSLNPGDSYTYLLQYRNTVPNSLADDVQITDELATEYFDVISPSDITINNKTLVYDVGGLSYTPEYQELRITVKLKDQLPSKLNFCNVARIDAANSKPDTSSPNGACIGVITECPYDDDIENINNPNCLEPQLQCRVVLANINRTTRKVSYITKVDSSNPNNTAVSGYKYAYGDDTEETFSSSSLTHDEAVHTFAEGDYTTKVTVLYTATGVEGQQSTDCASDISFEDEPISKSKTVANVTQDLTGKRAEDSVVRAGDELVYTLRVSNNQDYDRNNIDISDYIGDILDYAELDITHLQSQGGTFSEDENVLSWSDLTVPANGYVEKQFKVTLKDPIPSTNQPSRVSATYDCHISNEFGNQVGIKVDCPAVKGLETLPNTGPGTSLAVIGGATAVIGYFFSRSRLLAKETALIRRDFVATGGA